jgi:monoamine oxidase
LVPLGKDDADHQLLPAEVLFDGRWLSASRRRRLALELRDAISQIASLARTPPGRWVHLENVSIEAWLSHCGFSDVLSSFFSDLPPHAMSMRALLLMVKAAGGEPFFYELERFRIFEGTPALLRALSAPPAMDIRYRTVVSAIALRRRHVELEVCDAGWSDVIRARTVVVTTPPPCMSGIQGLGSVAALLPPMVVGRKCTLQIRGPLASRELLTDGLCRTIAVNASCRSDEFTSVSVFSRDRTSTTRHLVLEALCVLGVAQSRLLGYESFGWSASRWSKGSYPAFGPGCVGRLESVAWRTFVPLFFAGDFRIPAYAGYMEGALRSAEMVTEQVNSYLWHDR